MSDDIPFQIQTEIIKKLPIKSLIRFRSVSKQWKYLIDSSKFITDYSVPNSQSQRLLVSYRDPENHKLKLVLIDDDDSFPQRKCSLNVPMFMLSESQTKLKIIGSSHGLLCLYGYYETEDRDDPGDDFVLWNPSTRKSGVIKGPKAELKFSEFETAYGFGVCPLTNDPKLVKISQICYRDTLESISCIPSRVEVCTLSSKAWRIPSRNLPRKSISFRGHIVIGRFIYWAAFDRTNLYDDLEYYRLIISFDLTSEEFEEIYLPESLGHPSPNFFSVSKLRDSLVVFDWSTFGVWMMEHGVPNSFIKLFTVDAPIENLTGVLGFRKNGELMLEQTDACDMTLTTVDVYEPSSKHIKGLGINGDMYSFVASSYVETLMMLDLPDIL